jgi:flagellar assembly protein FliH
MAVGILPSVIGLGEIAAEAAVAHVSEPPGGVPNGAYAIAFADAREQGYKDGLKAGHDAGEEEWRLRVERLYNVVEGIEQAKAENQTRIAEDAVAIAFEAIVKILGQRQASRGSIAEVVEQIRRASSAAEPLIVRVGPDDYEALLAEPSLIELEDQRGSIRLTEDPRVVLGGCIVESSRGTLDARLETQIERLKSVLLDVQKADAGAPERLP